jgi:acetolactate synthase-1/2/3 large subunit
MSAIASASQNGSPMVVLAGRAPQARWGQGSLQEVDHIPFVRPLVKLAGTSTDTAEIPALVDDAFQVAATPHTGPAFVDFPLDHVFGTVSADRVDEPPPVRSPAEALADASARRSTTRSDSSPRSRLG